MSFLQDAIHPAPFKTLLGRFADQAQATPDALAIIDGQMYLTYCELAKASERIAYGLMILGVQSGQSLALGIADSWQYLAAVLGALKAGATIVPFDVLELDDEKHLELTAAGCVGVLVHGHIVNRTWDEHVWQAGIGALLATAPAELLVLSTEMMAQMFRVQTLDGVVVVAEQDVLRLALAGNWPGASARGSLPLMVIDACGCEWWALLLKGETCVLRADVDSLGVESTHQVAKILRDGRSAERYPPAPLPAYARRHAASGEQRRLLLLQQRNPTSTANHLSIVMHLGAGIDLDAMVLAWLRLAERHPALRTTFASSAAGVEQVVTECGAPCRTYPAGCFAEDTWQLFAERVLAAPFDSDTTALVQIWLLPFADGSGKLLMSFHQSVIDAQSLRLLFDDLMIVYEDVLHGRESSKLRHQLSPLDVAAWLDEWRKDLRYRMQRRALVDLHRSLGVDTWTFTAQAAVEPRSYRDVFDDKRCAALDQVCNKYQHNRFEVLLSVFAWGLHGLTDSPYLRIACPVPYKPLSEFLPVLGQFTNTLLLPAVLEGAETLARVLHQQSTLIRQVMGLRDVALVDIAQDLRLCTEKPFFDFMFVLDEASSYPDVSPAKWEFFGQHQSPCPLQLTVEVCDIRLACRWDYDNGCFSDNQITAIAELFYLGLDLLCKTPEITLDELLTSYRREASLESDENS